MNHLAKFVAGAFMAAVSSVATAQAFNLAEDWSTTSNPNGPWSYTRGTTLLPFQATTCCGLPPGTAFAPSSVSGSFLPIFYRPGPAGSDIAVHSYDPGNGGALIGEATLNWTSPVTGLASISGYFYYAQSPLQRSNDVIVRHGNAILGQATVSFSSFQDPANAWAFAFPNLAVSAGDMLSVSFARTAGQGAGTIVAGNVLVSVVPEVSSAVAMLLGLGLLVPAVSSRRSARTRDA